MRVDLDIDTLILRNLPYEQRYLISAAVEEELQRLFTAYGLPPSLPQDSYIPQITLSALSIMPDSKPQIIGSLIARQLYQSFHQPASSPQPHVSGGNDGIGRKMSRLQAE